MRFFTLTLLLLAFGESPIHALGRLVQPDGSQTILGEAWGPEGRTLLFPPQAVPGPSWLILPARSEIDEARIVTRSGRKILTFPAVAAPGTRVAFEVQGPVFSLTLRGQLPDTMILVRSLGRPEGRAGTWITRSFTDLRIDLPPWTVATGFTPVLLLTRTVQTPWEATLSAGGKSRRFIFHPSVVQWGFSPQAWGFFPTRIQISGQNAALSKVRIKGVGPADALSADPKTLLAWPAEAWRDRRREWFSWSGTSVLVLVTADYRIQDDYLKRLAFFVEKTGYRGRLVPDSEMAALHGWNAHDYSAPDLARFFTQAAAESFSLNPSEIELRDRLTAAGILVPRGVDSWDPGTGALVGISAQSPPALRAVLFVHEAFHGLYYTSPEFRAGVKTAWNTLSAGAQRAFRSFLAASQYDPGDEALMVNEFQAYVLQRTTAQWAEFFRDRVLAKASPDETLNCLAEYLAAAQSLDLLVESLYGLKTGDVSFLTTS